MSLNCSGQDKTQAEKLDEALKLFIEQLSEHLTQDYSV
jgi:hypothetical protein